MADNSKHLLSNSEHLLHMRSIGKDVAETVTTMIFIVILGAAVLCCCVLLTFGCVCHLFKRHGFSSFENDAETGRAVSMYQANEGSFDASTNNVTFEPLPDILAKTVGSRALRPRITCLNKGRQDSAAKLVTVYHPFPRNQLLYVTEIGLGWFGQVLQGTADNILQDNRHTKVVVKILKDDATNAEKSLFLEEVAPYRDLEHPHIVGLLGQCTETSPYLAILEFPPLGDLKAYLQTQKTGPFIQFAIDAAKGLSYLHSHSYVHHDFAARNCMLTSDLHVKVGDYGIGEDLYREDYYDTGCDLLPIRWMSPESLELNNGVWQPTRFTIQSNVWSLSILLWEILAEGRKPYNNLKDEVVLQQVVRDGTTTLPLPNTETPLRDRWYEIMEMCWQEVNDRPSTDDILAFLQQVEEESKQAPPSQAPSISASPQFVHVNQSGANSPRLFESNFVQTKTKNPSSDHIAEVLVHRVDDNVSNNHNFDDDFSQTIQIRQNKSGTGFEDDFVSGKPLNFNDSSDSNKNDSILAFGGNDTGDFKEHLGREDYHLENKHLNFLTEPVPVKMSTPTKPVSLSKDDQSEMYNTANSQFTQNSKFLSSSEGQNIPSPSTDKTTKRSEDVSNQLKINTNKSANQNSDEGYKSGDPVSPTSAVENETNSDSSLPDNTVNDESTGNLDDLEIEKAKEIYMSMGTSISPSYTHKSRSLGTIPEDRIPSDNTSQSGFVFEDPEADDAALTFEWDDYDVDEELVGRVRFPSDDSPVIATRGPRHVDVEEWTFDQDSESEPRSKPGSVASDSDAEVTRHSIGSDTSIDTRARIASILTNRLNSLITQKTNTSTSSSSQSMFYSLSDDDFESPEHDTPGKGHVSAERISHNSSVASDDMQGEATEDDFDVPDGHQNQEEDLIKQDLDKIAASVLKKKDEIDVIVTEPQQSFLSTSPRDVFA